MHLMIALLNKTLLIAFSTFLYLNYSDSYKLKLDLFKINKEKSISPIFRHENFQQRKHLLK